MAGRFASLLTPLHRLLLTEENMATGMERQPFLKNALECWRQRNLSGGSLLPRALLFSYENRVGVEVHIGDLHPQQLAAPRAGKSGRADERVDPRLGGLFPDVGEKALDL